MLLFCQLRKDVLIVFNVCAETGIDAHSYTSVANMLMEMVAHSHTHYLKIHAWILSIHARVFSALVVARLHELVRRTYADCTRNNTKIYWAEQKRNMFSKIKPELCHHYHEASGIIIQWRIHSHTRAWSDRGAQVEQKCIQWNNGPGDEYRVHLCIVFSFERLCQTIVWKCAHQQPTVA